MTTVQNQNGNARRKSFLPLGFFLFPLIHLLLAVPLAYYFNIWSDEASTLYTTQAGLPEAFFRAGYEKQAPLYFIVLSLWRLMDDSIFFARIFSVLCSLLSIGVFFVFVRRLWNEKSALFATFFLAIHPYMFWASTEIRVYSLAILFVFALLALFELVYLNDEEASLPLRFLYTGVAILALYTNFYIGFVLFGLFVVLLVQRRSKEALSYLLQMFLAGLFFLPLVWFTLASFGQKDGFHEVQSVGEALRAVWNHTLSFVLPTELFPPEEQTGISFVRVWFARMLLPVALAVLVFKHRMPDKKVVFLGITAFVVIGFFLVAYALLGKLYIELRHAAVLFPPMILFFWAFLYDMAPKGRNRRMYSAAIAVILVCSYSYAFTRIYPEWTKRGDWTRVAEYVEKHEKAGQPVVVFRNYEALAFVESYHGKNRVLPNERFFEWNYEEEYGSGEMFSKQIEYVISVIPLDSSEIWLVTEETCQRSNACGSLEKFVKENYTVVQQKDFYKERVRLLRKR